MCNCIPGTHTIQNASTSQNGNIIEFQLSKLEGDRISGAFLILLPYSTESNIIYDNLRFFLLRDDEFELKCFHGTYEVFLYNIDNDGRIILSANPRVFPAYNMKVVVSSRAESKFTH